MDWMLVREIAAGIVIGTLVLDVMKSVVTGIVFGVMTMREKRK